MGRGFCRPWLLKQLFAANPFVGCQFGRNRDRVTWVVRLALICADNKIADQNWPSGRLMGKVFLNLLRHPFMHRSHTSFGHIADFGSMGLQELYNLRVAGGLNNINARVGDFDLGFDLFVDVKKRI